jgi:DNA topoisomerase-1
MLETDHAKDATFNKNFFDDWSKVLEKHPPVCVNKTVVGSLH